MTDDEFFIGYLPKMPPKTSAKINGVLWCLLVVFIISITALVMFQKKFSTNTFEYGTFTTVEGYLFSDPVEYLAVPVGKDDRNEDVFQNILLVGEGKFNAHALLQQLESSRVSLEGIKISLKGFLIYGNGKALLQVTEAEHKLPIVKGTVHHPTSSTSGGEMTIKGEVVDSKCYFGVMKPGEGKAHRSCAIRCIAGGIPPLFHAMKSGEDFLLMNEHSKLVNEAILPHVGDNISITGEVIHWNDWRILKVNTASLQQLAHENKLRETLASFENGMTFCQHE